MRGAVIGWLILVACKSSSPIDGDAAGSGNGLCGNGVVDEGETCDGTCEPCNDGEACTADTATGAAETCDLACTSTPITECANNDGCCLDACTYATDNDCPPPTGTPLQDRLVVTDITAPAGVIPGVSNWRIWGTSNLRVGPVYTVPFADCGTLVGYTTGTVSNPRARVARLTSFDQLVTTYDLGAFTLRGLAAEPDGHWAALLWEQDANPETNTLHVRRFSPQGAQVSSTSLDYMLAAPTDFGIGESRLEYGNGRYGAYFHVHGISGFADGHEGDALFWVDAATGNRTTGWEWGCSHSMSNLLRYSPAANRTLAICVTDCFPGTSGDFAANSIGGIYLDHDDVKVRDFDANCGGRVAAELGSAAPGVAGWKLVFNGHQNAATPGTMSYNTSTMNQDIGFVPIANNRTAGAIVWLTTTPGNEQNASIARWQPTGDTAEQYVVGWSVAGTTQTWRLGRVNATGGFIEGPVTLTGAKWGERDDPFREHRNGDIVWAWFDMAGSTTLRFARLKSGGTASCAPL